MHPEHLGCRRDELISLHVSSHSILKFTLTNTQVQQPMDYMTSSYAIMNKNTYIKHNQKTQQTANYPK